MNHEQSSNRKTRPLRAARQEPKKSNARHLLQTVVLSIVLDCTESMTPYITGLLQALDAFLAILESGGFDVKAGLVLYRDEKIGEQPELYPVGTPISELRAILRRVKASGGGDEPESALPALARAIEQINAHDGGARVMLHITDAAPHLDEGPTTQSVVTDLLSSGVFYFACAPRNVDAYLQFAELTKGVLFPLEAGLPTEQFQTMLLEVAKVSVATLTMTGPAAGAEFCHVLRQEKHPSRKE